MPKKWEHAERQHEVVGKMCNVSEPARCWWESQHSFMLIHSISQDILIIHEQLEHKKDGEKRAFNLIQN